jgi:site-specific recombinase XerD
VNALVVIDPAPALPATLIPELEIAADYARAEKAEGTRKGYASDMALFRSWCAARHVDALPATPEVVAAYFGSLAESGLRPATISRRCSAIKYAHKLAGLDSPTDKECVKAVIRGIRRTLGAAPLYRKTPAVAEITRNMASAVPTGIKGIRDKAVILLGFASAMRRSELVALDVTDVEFVDDGLRIFIRKSKGDQEGLGQTVAVVRGTGASCPVRALRNWLDVSGITAGAIFRSIRKGGRIRPERLASKSVCDLVKAYSAKLGLNAADFGAHSLRSGLLTSAAARGATVWKLREVSRHKSLDTLSGYVRAVDMFRDHCATGLL